MFLGELRKCFGGKLRKCFGGKLRKCFVGKLRKCFGGNCVNVLGEIAQMIVVEAGILSDVPQTVKTADSNTETQLKGMSVTSALSKGTFVSRKIIHYTFIRNRICGSKFLHWYNVKSQVNANGTMLRHRLMLTVQCYVTG